MSWDVLIIGGGPAGATVASILLRYRPTTRVLILERSPFPRHHVGETLVTEINRVLHEMGAYDKVAAHGFVKKWGATFVWGTDSGPWDMIFGSMKDFEPLEQRFGEVQTAHTWHIRRDEYDKILLDHAGSLGAEVRNDVQVDALIERDGRTVGVRTSEGEELFARFVVDATGQHGIQGSLADRELDERLRNVAAYGYFRGHTPVERTCGPPGQSRAFICAHPHGWNWLFPVDDQTFSVGMVTSLKHFKTLENKDPEAMLQLSIDSSPEIAEILGKAELITYKPGMQRAYRMADFSYVSRSIHQPGLVRAGDAAGFVDPILSVGCFLGQSLGRFLGYALITCLEDPAADERRLLDGYADHVRDTLGAFRELTYFFYRFNERPDAWWAHARSLVASAGLPNAASNEEAFLAFATGFAARRSVFREPTIVFDEPFFVDAFRRLIRSDAFAEAHVTKLQGDDVIVLRGPVEQRRSAVPVEAQGRMAPSIRVEVKVDGSAEAAQTRRMHVPPSIAPMFGFIDGQRSVHQIGAALADHIGVADEHRAKVAGYARTVLLGLVERGLADVAVPTAP
jgi:flavin-dependent dehydrogenase